MLVRRRAGPRDEEVAGAGQTPEHAVEDPAQKAGAELCRQRSPRRDDGLPRLHPTRVLVHLDDGHAPLEGDHLPGEAMRPDVHEVAHGRPFHPFDLDHRPVYAENRSGRHRQSRSSRLPSPPMQRSARAGSV